MGRCSFNEPFVAIIVFVNEVTSDLPFIRIQLESKGTLSHRSVHHHHRCPCHCIFHRPCLLENIRILPRHQPILRPCRRWTNPILYSKSQFWATWHERGHTTRFMNIGVHQTHFSSPSVSTDYWERHPVANTINQSLTILKHGVVTDAMPRPSYHSSGSFGKSSTPSL